jgi:hypothetical protein
MAKPVHIELSPVVINDTWGGLTDCQFTSNGNAFSENLNEVRMHFRDSDNAIAREMNSTNGGVTIIDASNWQFTVNPITSLTFSAGTYFWSIETTDTNGKIKTYVSGTLNVVQDATI